MSCVSGTTVSDHLDDSGSPPEGSLAGTTSQAQATSAAARPSHLGTADLGIKSKPSGRRQVGAQPSIPTPTPTPTPVSAGSAVLRASRAPGPSPPLWKDPGLPPTPRHPLPQTGAVLPRSSGFPQPQPDTKKVCVNLGLLNE